MGKYVEKQSKLAVLDELLEDSLTAFAKVERVMTPADEGGSGDALQKWVRATNVTEFEPEKAMAAFSITGTERQKIILVWDDFGTVAQLNATVYFNGRVLIERRDGGYMPLRIVDESDKQVGGSLTSAGDYVEGFISLNITDPCDLGPFLQISFPEDDLDE